MQGIVLKKDSLLIFIEVFSAQNRLGLEKKMPNKIIVILKSDPRE